MFKQIVFHNKRSNIAQNMKLKRNNNFHFLRHYLKGFDFFIQI
jgi:hypothetical protein